MASEEIIEEETNLLLEAITKLEAKVILFTLVFVGLLIALLLQRLSPLEFLACLSVDGLLYKLLEKDFKAEIRRVLEEMK